MVARSALIRPALGALIADAAPADQRGTILSVNDSLNNLAFLMAPFISTAVLQLNPHYTGVVPAAFACVALAIGFRLFTAPRPTPVGEAVEAAVNAIRVASPADAAAIAAVHVTSWRETYAGMLPEGIIANNSAERRLALWERVMREGTRDVFVATGERGEVVGFICGGAMPAIIRGRAPIPGHDAYVDALYVLSCAHGRGIGRALISALAERLRERGFRSLRAARRLRESRRAVLRTPRRAVRPRGTDRRAPRRGPQSAYGWSDLGSVPTGALSAPFNLAAASPSPTARTRRRRRSPGTVGSPPVYANIAARCARSFCASCTSYG